MSPSWGQVTWGVREFEQATPAELWPITIFLPHSEKMSYQIEQNQDQWKLAYRVQSQVDIDNVRLVEATLTCKTKPEEANFPLAFALHFEASEATVKGQHLSIPVSFGFRVFRSQETMDVIIIGCQLEAEYTLKDDYQPTADELNAFKQGNAIFNCWPYFREYVQNSVTRMNFPPPTIPFLRLIPKLPPQVEQAKASEPKAIEAAPSEQSDRPALPIVVEKKKRRVSAKAKRRVG